MGYAVTLSVVSKVPSAGMCGNSGLGGCGDSLAQATEVHRLTTAWPLISTVGGPQSIQVLLQSSRTPLNCLVYKQKNDMLQFTWSQAMVQVEGSRFRIRQ